MYVYLFTRLIFYPSDNPYTSSRWRRVRINANNDEDITESDAIFDPMSTRIRLNGISEHIVEIYNHIRIIVDLFVKLIHGSD